MTKLRKGILLGAVALALVAGSSRPASAAVCGDLNNSNGVTPVTIADANVLAGFLAGRFGDGSTLCGGLGVGQCANLNQDAGVTVGDLVILLNVIAGNPTLFPPCSGAGPTIACNTNVRTEVTANESWPAGCTTFVDGTVFVRSPAVVTIQPGAVVLGRKASFNGSPSVLVFLRGAKINANGSAVNPIVFSSDQAPGDRTPGDWGGVVMNGRSTVNCPGGECIAEGLDEDTPFGGVQPNDSSGRIRFARIEFSGIMIAPDNELNVLTMNGVGRSTVVDHIMAQSGDDDCFEWFGGTVNAKFLVGAACEDDGLDWQLGYTGNVQYAMYFQNDAFVDQGGRHGFESDNNENGFDFSPRSNPAFCNVTVVGTRNQGGANGNHGAALRRGTAGKIVNSIIMGWRQNGANIGDNQTMARACTGAATLQASEPILGIHNTMFFNNGGHLGGSAASPCTPAQLYPLWAAQRGVIPGATNVDPANPGLNAAAPYPTSVADVTANYIPTAGSEPDTAATADCKQFDAAFFDTTGYMGAFVPGSGSGGNWMSSPWVTFNTN